MNKLIIVLLIFSSANLALADISCDERYNDFIQSNNNDYLQLELECYPEGSMTDSEFELSLECQEKYEQLGLSSSEELTLITNDCPDLAVIFQSDLGGENAHRPTRRHLIARIKKLEQKNKRLKNRINTSCNLS